MDSKEAKIMDLYLAEKIIKSAMEKANDLNIPSVIAVVDSGGHLKVLKRMDGAIFGSISIAIDKAFTAAATQVSTQELSSSSQPGQSLYGLNTTNQCRYVVFGGGIPLWNENKLIGAIGASGGTVEQDLMVAQAGADEFKQIIKLNNK
ncbi:heme-binding protein [Clostridium bovifaecis]|uniref:Heme-binding protein n=1 Tax=Clostridium bovifaecis TaxID=2184719 RepID=A0A6I6F2K6_9CLOT|nr:heme-binding protein [Clostridium bovifaecis]